MNNVLVDGGCRCVPLCADCRGAWVSHTHLQRHGIVLAKAQSEACGGYVGSAKYPVIHRGLGFQKEKNKDGFL